jgi:ATP-dependent Clp protease protease subunit
MWPFNPRQVDRQLNRNPTQEQLLRQRIVLIEGEVNDESATLVIAKLLYLQHEDARQPIKLRINSLGGGVTAGMAIVDTIKDLSPPVQTACPGQAHGMAAVILACGSRGQRSAKRGAELSLTPVIAGSQSTSVANLERTRQFLARLLAERCGQSEELTTEALVSGQSFTSEEALTFGLVDRIDE